MYRIRPVGWLGIAVLALGIVLPSAAQQPPPPGVPPPLPPAQPFHLLLWGEAGYWLGDVTYSIGGLTWDPEYGSSYVPDKISELSFPLDAPMGTVGFGMEWTDSMEVRGTLSKNLSDPSTKSTDSDYGDDYHSDSTLTIYSESDTELDAFKSDVSLRVWFPMGPQRPPAAKCLFGVGIGLLYEDLEWVDSNTEQWYPPYPELSHEFYPQSTVRYSAQVTMPYGEVATRIVALPVLFEASFGVSPYMEVSDEDDHLERDILSQTDASGVGLKGDALVRYVVGPNLFVQGQFQALSFAVNGTERDYVYGGEDAGSIWEIDHDISSSQVLLTLGVGGRF